MTAITMRKWQNDSHPSSPLLTTAPLCLTHHARSLLPHPLTLVHFCLTHHAGAGPPGTGKTHVGSVFARTILALDPRVVILCVCQTNHALDQFLEHLVAHDVTQAREGQQWVERIVVTSS